MALPVVGRAKALWDFAGGAPTDLPLRAGQVANITRKIDANWWECELGGNIGIVPAQYLQELPYEAPPPPLPAPAPPASSCVACGKVIQGDVLRWERQPYHPSGCLSCKKCRSTLTAESVIKKVGTDPHCQKCFNELMFGPTKAVASAAPSAAPAAASASPATAPANPRPLPRALHTPAAAVAAPANAQAHVEAPPPLPARQGSSIVSNSDSASGSALAHRPAPPPPAAVAPASAPSSPATQLQLAVPPVPARPGSSINHRPAPPPPVAEAAPPPVPYASRPAYEPAPAPTPGAASPAIPYATRPSYNGAAAANYASPPAAAGSPPNGVLMAQPTGVISHPNNPAAPLPPTHAAAPAHAGALTADAYVPPPPPPQVPVIIPPLNPFSTNRKVKAVFVGDRGVGKTAFLHAAVSSVFYQAYAPSQEGGLFNALIFLDGGKTAIDLELYDTPGDFYTDPNYRYGLLGVADVIIIMFDQVNRASFDNVKNLWWAEIRDKWFTLKPIIVLATKKDLVQSQTRYDPNFVRHQECLDFAQSIDAAKFLDTSALRNIMMKETLEKIAKVGITPLTSVKGNRRVERVQTERKKEGKRGVFGSFVDHVKYGM